MKSELHSAKFFRTDYKKLSKSETEDTDAVIKKLLNNKAAALRCNGGADIFGGRYEIQRSPLKFSAKYAILSILKQKQGGAKCR